MTWKELLEAHISQVSPKNTGHLSNLCDSTITIINQIPQSDTEAKKIAWAKRTISGCAIVNGIFDKSSGTMFYKANNFTVFAPYENYRKPLYSDFYSQYDIEGNENLFTANIGDLVIFRAITDNVPTTPTEFNALATKYKNEGGLLTHAEAFIKFNSDGTAWNINHIQMIKG